MTFPASTLNADGLVARQREVARPLRSLRVGVLLANQPPECAMRMEPLRIRDLFDPESVISQWVFALSTAVTDLATAESVFQDALHGDGPAAHTGYHYRQLIARLYEAERVVVAIDSHDEVRDFIAQQPPAEPAVEFLRGAYLPIDSSKVRETFGYARHRTVHHAHVGSAELRDSLADAHDQLARILVDTQRERLYYEWPEAVVSHVLTREDITTDEGLAAYAARVRFAQDIVAHFGNLLTAVMHPYAERVGVDIDRLYHDVREA